MIVGGIAPKNYTIADDFRIYVGKINYFQIFCNTKVFIFRIAQQESTYLTY